MADGEGTTPIESNGVDNANSGIAIPPRRKRGRPSNAEKLARANAIAANGVESGATVEGTGGEGNQGTGEERGNEGQGPFQPENFAPSETPKKRRGRPPGSGSRTKAETDVHLNIADTANEIEGAYEILAALTQNKAFSIGSAKAEMLARAIGDVAQYYNLQASGKTLATVKLIGVLGLVNAPIIMQLAEQAKANRAKQVRPATVASNVDEIFKGPTDNSGVRKPYTFN